MTKGQKEEILRVAINLENPLKEKFEEVQRHLGIKNRTDVLRWLINWYAKEIKKK